MQDLLVYGHCCLSLVVYKWGGFLTSSHDSKRNYKNLQVLREIKVRENFQQQYFGKISFTMFFLLLEHDGNKEELSAACN